MRAHRRAHALWQSLLAVGSLQALVCRRHADAVRVLGVLVQASVLVLALVLVRRQADPGRAVGMCVQLVLTVVRQARQQFGLHARRTQRYVCRSRSTKL